MLVQACTCCTVYVQYIYVCEYVFMFKCGSVHVLITKKVRDRQSGNQCVW